MTVMQGDVSLADAHQSYVVWLRETRDLSAHTVRAYDSDISALRRALGDDAAHPSGCPPRYLGVNQCRERGCLGGVVIRPSGWALPTLTLADHESEAVADLARRLAPTSPTASPMDFVDEARTLARGSDALTRTRSLIVRRHPVFLIRRLPVETNAATPSDKLADLGPVAFESAVLGLLASLVGQHRGFERESVGRLVQNVAPNRANQDLQISSSSVVELELHTELAYAEQAPDFILLLCVRRGDVDPPATLVAPFDVVARELPESLVRTLREPHFATSLDVEVRGRQERLVGPMPVLHDHPELGTRVRCDFGEVSDLDEEGESALRDLFSAVQAAAQAVVLDRGDLLVIDNRRCWHGRLPFMPRFDGSDRWLLRSYAWADGVPLITTDDAHVMSAFDVRLPDRQPASH